MVDRAMKVLLLDDHPLILDALDAVLHRLEPGIETRLTTEPDEALACVEGDGDIDLVLLDLKLGNDVDGFDVLYRLRSQYPALSVMVVSGTERLADVVRVVDSGAMGFLPKRSTRGEMDHALSMVLSGGVYIPQALLELISRMQERGDLGDTTISAAVAQLAAADAAAAAARALSGGGAAAPVPAPVSPSAGLASLGLTPRQNDVLALLQRGLPNKLIARELNLSVETVKDHVAAVLRALNVSSRTQAVLAVSRLTQGQQPPLPGG